MEAEEIFHALIEQLAPEATWTSLMTGQDSTHTVLSKLRSSMMVVRNVVYELEAKHEGCQRVKRHLNKLKHALYDAEDLVDEIQTVESQTQNTQDAGALDSFYEGIDSRIGDMNKKIFEGFKELINVPGLKGSLEALQPLPPSTSPATSLVNDSTIYGRGSEREQILSKILEDGDPSITQIRVVAITGISGIGKTALAQSVFDDPRARRTFDFKAWIDVPAEVFDISNIIASILDLLPQPSLTKDIRHHYPEFIQRNLRQRMARKRFLIVLDDVRDEPFGANEGWDAFCCSLQSAASGSTIVMTTCNKDIAKRFRPIFTLELPKLSDDDCWSLIKSCVSAGSEIDLNGGFNEIGTRIAAKCRGLPLAAKALGGLLENISDLRKWEDIENSRMWDLPPGRNQILPALLLSYYFLPPHLRRCFAYCSIFPKNWQFQKEKLLMLWMAEGFIHSSTRSDQVTWDCFDDLLARSFFQESGSHKNHFVMHDLIRELAVYVMGEFGFMLTANTSHVLSGRPRHFSYKQSQYEMVDKFSPIARANGLRTFLTMRSSKELRYYLSSHMLQSLGQRFACLRVLSLHGYNITGIPSSISSLKHLRYLDLSSTLIEGLPETLCSLYNLQTLLLSKCRKLKSLPRNIGNLIQMHHLDIRDTNKLQEMPEGIGKLSSLQMLTDFVVGLNRGVSIGELGAFVHLKGYLRISGLESVFSEEDAKAAKLIEKRHLDELILEAREKMHLEPWLKEQHERVLEVLRPHSDLRRLTIVNYLGHNLPYWVGDAAFYKLEFLQLRGFAACDKLPPLGQLPLLKHLQILDFDHLETVGPEFYGKHHLCLMRSFRSLKILEFREMSNWKIWSNTDVDASQFPRLEELHVSHCEKLEQSLPLKLPSLKVLDIRSCSKLRGALPQSAVLRELIIHSCPMMNLRNLADFACLTSLNLGGETGTASLISDPITSLNARTYLQSLELRRDSFDQGTRFNPLTPDPLSVTSSVQPVSISSINGAERILNFFALQLLNIYNSYDPSLRFQADHFKMLNHLNMTGFRAELDIIREEGLDLTSLYGLSIVDCPFQITFPAVGWRANNLTALCIHCCDGLTSLSNLLADRFPSLRCLSISHCKQLKLFAEDCLPLHLEVLRIGYCINLTSLPERISTCTSLQLLCIKWCTRLEVFPASGVPPNLQKLEIKGCRVLRCLPRNIQSLICLEVLSIRSCPRIESFPTGGLPPNLEILHVESCKKLISKHVDWQLHRLVFLKELQIGGFIDVDSFPADGSLPYGLTRLYLSDYRGGSLRSINCVELQRVTCLRELEIRGCRSLETFSGDLPQSLCRLVFSNFSSTKMSKGPDAAAKFSRIPCVELRSP